MSQRKNEIEDISEEAASLEFYPKVTSFFNTTENSTTTEADILIYG